MTLFIVIAGLLLVAVLAAVLYPLWRDSARHAGTAKVRELNLAVLREQRAELERDRAAGAIDAAAYEKAREELERRALEDLSESAAPPATGSLLRRPLVAGVVGLLVPAVAISLYLFLGTPGALTGKTPATAQNGAHSVDAQQIAT
ncbi:MAG: c-type cytochrome biogenesis protein CcmI, partial [Actinomycetota bacterium]